MLDFKDCPYCKEHTRCIVTDGIPEVIDDNLVIDTEYICTECNAVFNERVHYSIQYEYTETILQIDGDEEEDE